MLLKSTLGHLEVKPQSNNTFAVTNNYNQIIGIANTENAAKLLMKDKFYEQIRKNR